MRDTGVLINVERAMIDSSEGEALIDVPDDQCRLVRDSMTSLGAKCDPRTRREPERERVRGLRGLHQRLPPGSLLVRPDWKLEIAEEKCILCGKCIDACPHRALYPALMIREPFRFRETIAAILAETLLMRPQRTVSSPPGRNSRAYRPRPVFCKHFHPYTPDSDDPVIRQMAELHRKAGVGPMAAVAGAIAWAGVDA